MEAHVQLGINVRTERKAQRISQEALSDRSGVHVTEVNRIEKGHRSPSLQTMVKLARGLGVELSVLVAGIPGSGGENDDGAGSS